MISLAQAARSIAAQMHGEDVSFASVCTDTRALDPGCLYVALRGPNFDGHAFAAQAIAQGAVAVMVEERWAATQQVAFPQLLVKDTRLGLGALSSAWRGRFSLPLIGVTGSNGKTTVKEMCASILRAWVRESGADAGSVLATEGNLNNDIGVPKMLLRMGAQHRAAVIEMGMSHPGEIAYLSKLSQPTVAVVTNAQRAHLAGMGSTSAVAREKGAIYEGLGTEGVAVINADEAGAGYWREVNRSRRVLTFGLEHPADVSAHYVVHGLKTALQIIMADAQIETELQVPGVHNVRNALAAATACLAAGATYSAVAAGLREFGGAKGRLQQRAAINGAVLLDDTYNANPDSVRAAIDVLCATQGRKIMVLGDMGEIGEMSAQCHDEIGGYAKSQGVDRFFALGEQSAIAARNFGEGGYAYTQPEALLRKLKPELAQGVTVLVKGSRFMHMERISNALAEEGDTP